MKVLLIHIDGKLPNLALMKVSAYHKSRGNQVGLHQYDGMKTIETHPIKDPDEVYVSCIFKKNLSRANRMKNVYLKSKVYIGGPALWKPNRLPEEIDCMTPDYSLYPDLDYSIEYTTRGCPNRCPFCIVPEVEGEFREYKSLDQIHNPAFSKIVLLDNNFLASKLWREKLRWLNDRDLKVSFCQGLDARLVTHEKASELADTKCTSLNFKNKRYYFAWDLMHFEKPILKGLQTIIDVGIKPRDIMIYVLAGFNTTHLEDYYRFKKLRQLEVDPFIMTYNNRKDDTWLNNFTRYVNKRIYKVCKLSEYNKMPTYLRNEIKESS